MRYFNLQEDKTYGNERGNDWFILDNKRETYNIVGQALYPNTNEGQLKRFKSIQEETKLATLLY